MYNKQIIYSFCFFIVFIIEVHLNINNTIIQLVILTTFIFNKYVSKNKILIQKIVYNSLCHISRNNSMIKIIIYIDKNDRVYLKQSNNIIIKRIPKYNIFNTPYFGALMEQSIKRYKSNYYMYINGDIVITPYIYEIIKFINKYKEKGVIKQNILCVATRSTLNFNSLFFYNSIFHYQLYKKGIKSATYSQDVFLMNEMTYKSHLNTYKNLLIGRAGIDNIILGCALKDKSINVIDFTNSIAAIHLEDCLRNKKYFISV